MSSLKALVLKHLKTLNSHGQNQTCAELPVIATSQSCHYAKKLIVGGSLKTQLRGKLDWELRMQHFCQWNYAFQSFLELQLFFPVELQALHAYEILKKLISYHGPI